MEIHIQLAGVQLGPYSEKQVRDYLQEGLLSSEDPARFDGVEAWQTVDEVLKGRPAAAPIPVEPPKAPEPISAPPHSPVATSTMPLPKTSLRKTAGITTSLLPIPKPLSKDTIRVPIPQLNKSVAQQTTLVKKAIQAVPQPSAPPTPSAAKASEKARTSLLTAVKILTKKPDAEAPTPSPAPAAPEIKASSPSTVPIAFPKSAETRTMPMSVVRAISKKSDINSTSPPEAGTTRPLPKFGSAPLPQEPDLKRTTLLSAMPKLPPRKTEPAAKAEKAVEAPIPPTANEASFQSAKLPQTLMTSPMAPVRALPKKKEPETKTTAEAIPAKPAAKSAAKVQETSPAEAVRFVADNAPLAPGAVNKAPPVSPEVVFSNKSLNRTTGKLSSLVRVLEKKPDESTASPTAKDAEIKPPSTTHLPEGSSEEEYGDPKPSFFKSLGEKIGMLFRSSEATETVPPVEPEPPTEEVKQAAETVVLPEKKAVVEEKKIEIQEKPQIKEKPVAKKSTPLEEPKSLLGLKTLPPAPPEEDEKAASDEEDIRERLRKEQPFVKKKGGLPGIALAAIGGLVLVAGLSCLGYFYVQSSHQAAAFLLEALKSGDQAKLKAVIDFPYVQKSLVEQMTAQVAKTGSQDTASRAAGQEMIKKSVDYYVTPQAISDLIKNPSSLPSDEMNQRITPARAAAILSKLNTLPVKSQTMVAYNRFVVDLDAAKLDMVYAGANWKLNQVELNFAFKFPEEPGSASPPTDLGASISSTVLETYFEDGKTKFEKQDWDGAIVDYNQVLAMDPKQIVAYSNRGMARASKGDLEGAIADFSQAISLDPKLAEAYFNRGIAKTTQKDLDGAVADFSQAITLDPKMAAAFYKRGTIRTLKGDFEGALADFSQNIELDPTSASAFSNRGYIKKAQHDLDGAIADFTQALAVNPKIVEAYYNRGLAKYEKADLDGAVADFNKALDLDPKMTRGYYSRGIAKNTKNDLDGAMADYNQALTLDPNLVPALTDRALVRQAKGDLKGALDDYNRALAIDPKIGTAYYGRGLIKEQLNDLDGAISDSSRALDMDPKQAQAYYNRGFAKLVKGGLDGAKADLLQFCKLASKDPYADHARLYLWLITMAQNPTGTANIDLSDALQNNWSLGPNDLVTKIAQFLLGTETEADLIASADSSDAKKDAGQHCEVWYFAGMKRLLAGDKATAIDYFHKCLATGQKDYCEYILAQAELQVLAPNP